MCVKEDRKVAESNTKRYIKRLIQIPIAVTFWGSVIVLVYVRALYNNVYDKEPTEH